MHRAYAFTLAGLLTAGALAAAAQTGPAAQFPAPLIERAKFFGNPTRTGGQLSPDGRWLSWIAPRDGVLNIWVAPANNPSQARALTSERTRPIRSYFWAPDSSQLLFINDRGGDEDFLLYGVPVAGGEVRNYTPFEKTRVLTVGTSDKIKDRILIGLNNRDPRWHDVHSLDLRTGRLTLVMRNDGWSGFTADEDLNLRIASKQLPDGSVEYHRVANGAVEPRAFETVAFADAASTAPIGFTADGRTLYWIDARDRDTSALVAHDWASGRKTVLGQNPRADIAGALTHPRTNRVEAYAVNYLRNEWTALDPAVKADLDFLRSNLKGEIGFVSRTDADDKWVVVVDPVTAPSSAHLYDRRAKRLTQLYVTRPELQGAPLVTQHPVEIRSRDGLTLVSYLTLPPGTDPDGDGRPNRPVPMVLFVHGGPWARDAYGFSGSQQWLSNRGYAVLRVNYRGSTGFGKKFVRASDREWGGKMHDDLIDAVDWAIGRGVTTRDKVAIMGGSYGGYATLVGLTFTPDRFACGVDIVGPSNLATLIATFPPYWTSGLSLWHQAIGKPGTPEGDALLRDRSPLFRADRISKPLLIAQGANDPRVKKPESDQIVQALQSKNIPVTYVLFPDEGHGFARPENNIAFNAVAENFLQSCLGGRAEPIGDALRPSTAQVPVGAEIVRGLREALPVRTAAGTD